MKKLLFLLLFLPLFSYGEESQPHKWLHIYRTDSNFCSIKATEIDSISHVLHNGDSMIVNKADSKVAIPLSKIDFCALGTNVPTLYITIPDNPDLEELVDKDTYLNAILRIDGNGLFEDVDSLAVSIKGRGNTTWQWPKKPYRFKFDKKVSLFGFEKAKSYALIANYIDCSLMRNAVALKIGQLLEMPYTNHCQPIRVYFNGIFKGAYILTEKIGTSGASVDIDEETGILFELDTNYDEAYKFRTPNYDLPVMVKDPDLEEIAEIKGVTPDSLLSIWQNDFELFEEKVYNGEDISNYLDMESLVNYIIVYNVCGNKELTWPNSVYMYKKDINDVYHLGPIWDFDWAFTYNDGIENRPIEVVLFGTWEPLKGAPFFRKLCSTPEFMALYEERFNYFKENLLPQLLNYMDEYAEQIEPSAIENGVVWPAVENLTEGSFDFRENTKRLKQWILDKIDYISGHENFGLY